jgi:peptidoglycan/xylan/chitin deacetylase (PgdA/CDA1 family)
MSRVLILAYHSVDDGPPPLSIDPALFARHLDCIAESGARVLTIRELADALRTNGPAAPAVAITFDDGFANVVDVAYPLLAEHEFAATVFCVASHLGAMSDWPSQAPRAPRLPLARPSELARLAEAGWEIGSHGLRHDPLEIGPDALRRDFAESKRVLEEAVGVPVSSYAYPYGVVPRGAAAVLAETGYRAACTGRLGTVQPGADPFALPRVDMHYLRRPALLRSVLAGRADLYLGARRLGARARRVVRRDYVAPA